MITRMKNSLDRVLNRMIAGRQETINFRVADMIKHDYPPNTSLHAIVRDLKSKEAK